MTNRKIDHWVIPPEVDAEFASGMDEVFETYGKPYDLACPVVCIDERPVQLQKELLPPDPTTEESRGNRVEHERVGNASIFMFIEPLTGWLEVTLRPTKTKFDWAIELARLLDGRYAHGERSSLSTRTGTLTPKAPSPSRSSRNAHAA